MMDDIEQKAMDGEFDESIQRIQEKKIHCQRSKNVDEKIRRK